MIAPSRVSQRTCLALFSCTLFSCAPPAKIPIQQTLYKMTYEYLRSAECLNDRDDDPAYMACDRSYHQDFNRYRQLREEFVNSQPHQDISAEHGLGKLR